MMLGTAGVPVPTRQQFLRGIREFEKHERRDAMYRVATFLVSHFWGRPKEMADSLGVLLLTWNQAWFRYGPFDFDQLERAITSWLPRIEPLRKRDILGLKNEDEDEVRAFFNVFLKALRIASGTMRGRTSPVAAAKALHLLAPGFFPLWDDAIARAYDCYYNPEPAEKYVVFCRRIRGMGERVKGYVALEGKTLLKLIDEYNYAKYTKEWM